MVFRNRVGFSVSIRQAVQQNAAGFRTGRYNLSYRNWKEEGARFVYACNFTYPQTHIPVISIWTPCQSNAIFQQTIFSGPPWGTRGRVERLRGCHGNEAVSLRVVRATEKVLRGVFPIFEGAGAGGSWWMVGVAPVRERGRGREYGAINNTSVCTLNTRHHSPYKLAEVQNNTRSEHLI